MNLLQQIGYKTPNQVRKELMSYQEWHPMEILDQEVYTHQKEGVFVLFRKRKRFGGIDKIIAATEPGTLPSNKDIEEILKVQKPRQIVKIISRALIIGTGLHCALKIMLNVYNPELAESLKPIGLGKPENTLIPLAVYTASIVGNTYIYGATIPSNEHGLILNGWEGMRKLNDLLHTPSQFSLKTSDDQF
jgi:hypothetical protein